ncbi:spore germination protein [Bacillus sp. FJAT-42315]|uniref:spore germination protein n=1 Tax=Bacillus sp. FJAT-42315 TaxID=2014077 RepID=UPI000C23AA32
MTLNELVVFLLYLLLFLIILDVLFLFIRFPFFIFAQLLRLAGIAVCRALLLLHMLKLPSLGRPFLEPLFPMRRGNLKDADQQILQPNKLNVSRNSLHLKVTVILMNND